MCTSLTGINYYAEKSLCRYVDYSNFHPQKGFFPNKLYITKFNAFFAFPSLHAIKNATLVTTA